MKLSNALITLSLLALAPMAQAAKLVRQEDPTSPFTYQIQALHAQFASEVDRGSQFAWSATYKIESRKASEKWSSTIKQAVHKALGAADDFTSPDHLTLDKPFYLSSSLKRGHMETIIAHGFNLEFVSEMLEYDGENVPEVDLDAYIDAATDELIELSMEDNRILVAAGSAGNSFGNSDFVALVDLDAGEIFLFGLGYAE